MDEELHIKVTNGRPLLLHMCGLQARFESRRCHTASQHNHLICSIHWWKSISGQENVLLYSLQTVSNKDLKVAPTYHKLSTVGLTFIATWWWLYTSAVYVPNQNVYRLADNGWLMSTQELQDNVLLAKDSRSKLDVADYEIAWRFILTNFFCNWTLTGKCNPNQHYAVSAGW
jgi:hypothetical protein